MGLLIRVAGVGLIGLVAAAASSVSAQQDGANDVTTVAPLVVTGAMAPISHVGAGAPVFTLDEIHSKGFTGRDMRETFEDGRATLYGCYVNAFGTPPNAERMIGYEEGSDAARRMSSWSNVAEAATEAAQQARIDKVAGRATQDDVDRTELARQDAVNELVKAEADYDEGLAKAIDIQEMAKDHISIAAWGGLIASKAADRHDRRNALVPKELEDLALENVKAAERHDDKGDPFLYVTGSIHNTRKTKIAVPPLTFTAVDQFGFPLQVERGEAPGRIDPGGSQAFTYSFKPSPPRTTRVVVTFAALKTNLHLEPADADPVCGLQSAPRTGPGSADCLIPELNPARSGGGAADAASGRTIQLNSNNGGGVSQCVPPPGR